MSTTAKKLGLKERYEHVSHHNFVFSRDHEEEFDAIYKRGEPAPDPTAYVCAPSQTEPAVAPSGGGNVVGQRNGAEGRQALRVVATAFAGARTRGAACCPTRRRGIG